MNAAKEIRKHSYMKNVFGTNVVGQFIDKKVDKKLSSQDNKLCYPYFPEVSKTKFGKYKEPFLHKSDDSQHRWDKHNKQNHKNSSIKCKFKDNRCHINAQNKYGYEDNRLCPNQDDENPL